MGILDVQFDGGTPEERAVAQAALEQQINSRTWQGRAEACLRRGQGGWAVVRAIAYPSGVGAGPLGSPWPVPEAPWDCRDNVKAALRAAGVTVDSPTYWELVPGRDGR